MPKIETNNQQSYQLLTIPLRRIVDGESYRLIIDKDKIKELAASMKASGLLQLPMVTKIEGDQYKIVFGNRRMTAARYLGWKEIEVMVMSGDDSKILGVLENLQREDLTQREEALAVKSLSDAGKWSQDQLATMVGKNKSTISKMIKLGNLIEEYGEAVAFTKLPISTYLELVDTPELLILAEDGNWIQKTARQQVKEFKQRNNKANVTANTTGALSKRKRRIPQKLENYEPVFTFNGGFEINPFRFSRDLSMDTEAVIEKLQELQDKVGHLIEVLRQFQSRSDKKGDSFEGFDFLSEV